MTWEVRYHKRKINELNRKLQVIIERIEHHKESIETLMEKDRQRHKNMDQ